LWTDYGKRGGAFPVTRVTRSVRLGHSEAAGGGRILTGMEDTAGFNSRLLSTLASHERVCTFERGTTLFRAGDAPLGVHVLLSGEVDLQFDVDRHAEPVHFDVAGQILGLSSLVSGRNQEYTALARTSVVTGFVDRDTFFRILHEAPERWFDVLQVLSRDISSCYDRVKEMASRKLARL
jgi:CRP-like cAMP-binding protein